MVEIKFTKKQQRIINSHKDKRLKDLWIEQFTFDQKLKQSPEYKQFMKNNKV